MSKNLIRSVKKGNADIVEKIVTENYESIYKYCYWKIGNSEEAQDIIKAIGSEIYTKMLNPANIIS